jgi:hypothetical protein
MKITAIETYIAGNPWKNWLFTRVLTDEGIYGIGEGTVNHFARTVEAAIHELEPLVLGLDPFQIELLSQRLVRDVYTDGAQIHMCAVAAIEIACWGHYRQGLQPARVQPARRGGAGTGCAPTPTAGTGGPRTPRKFRREGSGRRPPRLYGAQVRSLRRQLADALARGVSPEHRDHRRGAPSRGRHGGTCSSKATAASTSRRRSSWPKRCTRTGPPGSRSRCITATSGR